MTPSAALYAALGARIFDTRCSHTDGGRRPRGPRHAGRSSSPCSSAIGLPASLADALDDPSWDAEIQAETDEALGLTGKDVGTPILHFEPPEGRCVLRPGDQQAARTRSRPHELWDHVDRAWRGSRGSPS